MFKYYGNKGRFGSEIRAAMPSSFNKYLELCGGIASVARTIIPPSVERTVVEKDTGQVSLLKVTRDKPVELLQAMQKIPYSRDYFDYAGDIRDSGYAGCDDLLKAVVKKVLTDMSYNAACKSYRNIDLHVEDDTKDKIKHFIKAQQFRERYYRQLAPDIMRMSSELKGIDIICDDLMNHLDKLDDEDLFVMIDPPYRPAVRQAKKIGYDVDMSDNQHYDFLEKMKLMDEQGKLNAKVMIFGYVEEELQNDLYCQYLLSMGFRLIYLKDIYLPRIVRGKMNKRKTVKTECIFINYNDCMEKDFVTEDRIYTYDKVFGGT